LKEKANGIQMLGGPSEAAAAAEVDALAAAIRACRLCRDYPLGKPLPHEPRPVVQMSSTARICIASQAPGTKVHASGRPFTDLSGDRLRAWMGVDAETFYDASRIAIIPMGFCFPGQDAKGGDLPPRRECAPAWRKQVFDLLPRIDLILAVGSYAFRWHLGKMARPTLSDTVAAWREIYAAEGPARILPLPHPSWRNNAWIKKNPWFETELLPVVRREVARRL
jgi:uracil-DNA glycosylase